MTGGHPQCAACGSEAVLRDAWAAWDPDQGCWTPDAVFNRARCADCDAAAELVWIEASVSRTEPRAGE